jgi:hypothetical protein
MGLVRLLWRPLRTAFDMVRTWLPEGPSIPDDIWRRRHLAITRFALVQAVALGAFGLARLRPDDVCLGHARHRRARAARADAVREP